MKRKGAILGLLVQPYGFRIHLFNDQAKMAADIATVWQAGDMVLPAKWTARIQVNGRYLHLGLFDSIESAAQARVSAAEIHHGQFARAA